MVKQKISILSKRKLAKEIKKILQEDSKTWDKAKKKALDRKNYIEGLLMQV